MSTTASTSADAVLVTRHGAVLEITINRPEAKNAVNADVAQGIAAAVEELDGDPEIAVGIITGAGGVFCAGMDLKGFLRGEDPTVPGRGFAGLVEGPPLKPLIAAVEGYALAGGFEIVLACDMVVAAENARFGIPEAKRGLVAGAGGLVRLPDRIPPAAAMELALTGDPIDAARAHQLGLVNRVVGNGEAVAAAHELASRIAANGPLATRVSKQVLTESRSWPADERFDRQRPIVETVFTSRDAKEGAQAFAEKRAPVWEGR
ncbi:crotonase/enoyl-CoA hydratase family protein [Streptomyces sp. Y7]|uniref:crotonase/enoyl-CoA hydratase family protein n=1 Tax=Streptomyces sp. Y7 TaxID=3342392 RepID=UPI00371A5DA8